MNYFRMLKTSSIREFQRSSRTSKIQAFCVGNAISGGLIGSTYGVWRYKTRDTYRSSGNEMTSWLALGVIFGIPVVLPITADIFSHDLIDVNKELKSLRYALEKVQDGLK